MDKVVGDGNQGPSEAGYHFLQDYKNCKRYTYHKYVDDVEGSWTAPALLFGLAGHAGLEAFYLGLKNKLPLGQRIKDAVGAFQDQMHKVRSLYEYNTAFEEDLDRGSSAIREYGLYYPDDPWHIVAIEETLSIVLPSGNRTTCRIDLVVKDQRGDILMVDHKFTGWSLNLFKNTLKVSDQTTHYKAIWDYNHPEMPVRGIIYNVIRAYKDNPPDYDRLPIFKTTQDVDEYILDIDEEFEDMRNRFMTPDARWPKNTGQCFKYNRLCEFSPICMGARNVEALVGLQLKRRNHQFGGVEN